MWPSGSKRGRREGRKVELTHRQVFSKCSAQKGEESGSGWHFLQPGGAKRLSEHSYRSGQYKLWLSPVTWAVTKSRSAAMVVWQWALETEKQSHGAWLLALNLPELAPLTLHLGCRAHYLKTQELILQKQFFPQ